jgi:hypothetical protein
MATIFLITLLTHNLTDIKVKLLGVGRTSNTLTRK